MPYRFSLEFASMTDTGQLRAHNEDSIIVCASAGLAVLADGMGGYNAGEVASGIATSEIQRIIEAQPLTDAIDQAEDPLMAADWLLHQAVAVANLAILDASDKEPDYNGMGTTVVAALFHDDTVTIAHVGDSRAYRLRDRQLQQITRDHSLLQEQLDAGLLTLEQAQFAQHKNLITRAVGVDPHLDADINAFDVAPGDCYLLCSDGLSDMLSDARIADILIACGADITTAVQDLVAQANAMGGRDNISVILIRVNLSHLGKNDLIGRFRHWISE